MAPSTTQILSGPNAKLTSDGPRASGFVLRSTFSGHEYQQHPPVHCTGIWRGHNGHRTVALLPGHRYEPWHFCVCCVLPRPQLLPITPGRPCHGHTCVVWMVPRRVWAVPSRVLVVPRRVWVAPNTVRAVIGITGPAPRLQLIGPNPASPLIRRAHMSSHPAPYGTLEVAGPRRAREGCRPQSALSFLAVALTLVRCPSPALPAPPTVPQSRIECHCAPGWCTWGRYPAGAVSETGRGHVYAGVGGGGARVR